MDFRILGTEVNGQPLSPSLTTLPPQSTAVGVWQLKSSLQGLFTDYTARFEHIDGLGDPRLSLIREVEIHEMTRLVQVLGPDQDNLPDFLTNDIPDHNHFPDTIHFSQGGSAPVLVHETASIVQRTLPDGGREIEINSALGQGFGYLRIPDPLGPDWHLVSATRPDGRNLPVERNVWRTDRTFPGFNQKARAERILHLFDGDANGRHTLVFQPAPAADVTAPESSVQSLPDQSPALIPLAWSGSDDGGIAWYDIFVSKDNGPWTPWLERSTLTAALFTGEMGSSYAFYSRATDLAGNVEIKTPNAEAVTTVSLANTPPVATPTGPVSVDAGRTLSIQLTATDPDGPDSELRFRLVSGPSGMTVDALTGQVRWVTASSDGGRSLEAVVSVTDAGLPPASAEFRIPIQVRRVNRAPSLEAPAPRTLTVGETLIQALIARDDDVPAQTLRFSIVSGAPNGLTLDAETGILRWTATRAQAGNSYPLVVAVTDDGEPAATTTRSFPLSVAKVPLGPPVFDPLPAPLWLSGSPRELAIRATDPDGTAVTISATSLPPGATFLACPGSGHATLRWTPAAHHAGLHFIQLTATTPGEATQTSLTLRVENPDDYWTWAAETFGPLDAPGDYGPLADPDNDGAVNLIERLFFRDPLTPDDTPLDFEKIADIDDQWSLFRMEFLRHETARRQIRTTPLHSTDLQTWQPLLPWTYQPSIRRATAPDSPPGAEEVELRLLMPRGALQGFFQLETTLLPPWSEASP